MNNQEQVIDTHQTVYNEEKTTQSLYIHWPFCPYKCHFCPFVALAAQDALMPDYHRALQQEVARFAGTTQQPLHSIYFGGGTPSTYPDDLLLDMFGTLNNKFIISGETEITIEVNPGTINQQRVEHWRTLGINRLSVGVQSLNDRVLHSLNRLQRAEQVYELMRYAPMIIPNISMDIILGLPGITAEEWRDMIKTIVQWPIQHISMYFLMVHDETPLYFKVRQKKVALPADSEVVDLYHWSCEYLAQHGFEQYEISSFTRAGFACRHNQAYWNRMPYKGFGLGACSFDGDARFQNEKNIMRYIKGVNSVEDITILRERLTVDDIRLERMMLGLRRPNGVDCQDIYAGKSGDALHKVQHAIADCIAHKLLQLHDNRLSLTPIGLVVENDIIARLL